MKLRSWKANDINQSTLWGSRRRLYNKRYHLNKGLLLQSCLYKAFTDHYPSLSASFPESHNEFEAIADRLADEFQMYIGDTQPLLLDYAISRAEIYEEQNPIAKYE